MADIGDQRGVVLLLSDISSITFHFQILNIKVCLQLLEGTTAQKKCIKLCG